jgi:hypothetical protein
LKYSLDTSALLDCWVRYYPPDVFPQVWEKLDQLVEARILIASEEIVVELKRKHDGVYRWAHDRSGMLVPTSNEEVQQAVSKILAVHPKLIDERASRSGADPWVIAVAHVFRCSVLTGERPSRSPKRPHIPDVCDAMSIRWVDMLQLFRDQHWVFG